MREFEQLIEALASDLEELKRQLDFKTNLVLAAVAGVLLGQLALAIYLKFF